MDKDDDVDSKKESVISRFTLDGVVVDEVIEVDEDNEHLSHKTLKLNDLEDCKELKTYSSESDDSPIKKSSFDKCLQQRTDVLPEQTEIKADDDYSPRNENYLSVNDGENPVTEEKISSRKETETEGLKESKELASVSNNEVEAEKSQDERNSLTHKELELDHYSSDVTEVDENGMKKSKLGVNKSLNSPPSQEEIEADESQDHEFGLDKLHGKEKELRSRKRKIETVTPKIKIEIDEKDDVQDVQVYYPTRKRRKTGNTSEDTEVQIKTEIIKTPDSKRKAAFEPLDVKPSIYQMLCAKRRVVKLGDIPSVAERIKRTKVDLVHLYRLLFSRSPKDHSMQEHIMKGAILNFKGFPFDGNSSQFLKRKQMLESLEFYRIIAICNVLGFCKESKSAMVSKILEFLLKPYDIMGVEKDPSMQPYVKLERLSLDKYVVSSDEEKADSGRSLRKRRASASKGSEPVKSPAVKAKNVTLARTKTPLRSVKIKQFGSKKKSKPVRPIVSSESAKSPAKSEHGKSSIKSESLESGVKSESKKSATKHGSQKPSTLKSQKPNITPDLEKISNASETSPVASEVQTEAKESIVEKDIAENTVSNEGSQENIEDGKSKATKKTSPIKKIVHTRKGRPLRVFPKINQSIKNANFSALQRLHILLFGASDKAENLKGNILAFGGFPFLEGSEEWKQKHFLLSLLAQNTLREYLNLLCIEYGDDDQPTMINKLMKFLAAPNETTQEAEATDIETKAVSPELTNKKSVQQPVKVEPSKKKGKKVKKKSESRPRKMLMSDAEVRRLEAEIARAQRILDREKRINEAQVNMLPVKASAPQVAKPKALPMKTESLITKQADVDQINALLQTVYKRRALKAAGAVVSTPNKGTKTKLGDLANVKFLVVTANYNDLSVLHHLIFMAEANKAKIRKNILDFDGFGFNEDSKKYKQRMDFLNRLGYDISKRIAFLLGLCPFQTDIPQQDLNELIMYFLMSPCITKQVPITQLPQTFFRQELPKELSSILQNNEEEGVSKSIMIMKSPSPSSKEETSANVGLNMPGPSSGQKAKKSLRPSAATLPPMKKMVLSTTGSPQNTTQRSLIKSPTSNTTPTIQQQFSKSLLTIATSNNTQPSVSPSLANRKILIKSPPVVSSPQEYFIQQQTPDGQQKTFKVIRFAQPPPVTSVFTARSPQSPVRIQAPTTSVNMSISGASLPPGIILLKNKPSLITQPVPNLLQSVPFVINQQANRITGSVAVSNSINVVPPNSEEYVLPDEVNAKSSAINWNEEDVEVLHPLEDNPPTDEELYASIQEIIHSSNFEDITLRNVIDRVSAQYSNHDLTHRHNYMKECVKKIIIGT